MTKILNINNQEIKFEFLGSANCWRAEVIIGDEKIEIEIDFEFHKQDTIDWGHFESFFRFISQDNRLKTYVAETIDLTLKLGKTIFRNSEGTRYWEMHFSKSIYYNGTINNNYSFSLIYNYAHPTEGYGDDYGNYLVDFESNTLKGVRRYQC